MQMSPPSVRFWQINPSPLNGWFEVPWFTLTTHKPFTYSWRVYTQNEHSTVYQEFLKEPHLVSTPLVSLTRPQIPAPNLAFAHKTALIDGNSGSNDQDSVLLESLNRARKPEWESKERPTVFQWMYAGGQPRLHKLCRHDKSGRKRMPSFVRKLQSLKVVEHV